MPKYFFFSASLSLLLAPHRPRTLSPKMATMKPAPAWPSHDALHDDDFAYGASVASCDAAVQRGFLRKVFGLVAAQLALTAALSAAFMFYAPLRSFAIHNHWMMMVSFVASLGLLVACQVYAHSHPTNLYLLFGFTLAMAWSVATTCGAFAAAGLGLIVLEAPHCAPLRPHNHPPPLSFPPPYPRVRSRHRHRPPSFRHDTEPLPARPT